MAAFQILLIEKDEATRKNWAELLNFCQYYVVSVSDFDLIKKFNYDVIIADTDVTGLDGLALKSLLNNDFIRIPIIFVSADNVPKYSLEREEVSAISFLQKPFENSLLLEYVLKAKKIAALLKENPDTQKAIARLLITQPQSLPVEHVLKRSYTLGRYRDSDTIHADIRLASASASRKHAFLIRVYKGAESYYKLIDFSSNGILINGRRMPKMCRLNHQDEIQFYSGCKAVYTEIDREAIDLDVTLTQE